MNELIEMQENTAGQFVQAKPSRLRRFAAKATGAATAASAAILSAPAFALTADQNSQITAAYDATGVSTELVIAGLLGVVLLITGFGIIYGLLKR